MRTRIASIALAFIVATTLYAASPEDRSTDFAARRAAAERESGGHRAKLFVDIARDEMEAADRAFTEGAVDNAQKLAEASADDAQKSADAAVQSGKRLKDTEIDLRKLQVRTRDITRSLALDDRPPMEKIVQRIEQMRQSLLDRMFGDKKKEKP